MAKQPNTPLLRFPEFAESWQNEKMGRFAKFSKGKGISKSDISEDGETECIRYGELYTIYNEVIDRVYSKTNINKNELVFSEANDVIIPGSGETQIDIATASCVLKSGIALGGDLNIIKTANNGVFLSYYLNNRKKIEIAKIAQGNSVVHLYASQLASLYLNIPTLPEQQKIASFLTAIDTKLTQLKQKKSLLKQYKKGVMQKIFSREIRFRDENGKEFPKWSKKTLKSIGEIVGGGTPDTTKSVYWNGNINWFTPTELKSKYVSESLRKISIDGLKQSSAKILPKGALLFSSRATVGDISITLDECCTNQGFQSFLVNEFNSTEFLYYWITNNKKLFLVKASGSTFLEISKGEIQKIEINLPCLPEQTKIANFLTALDEKINHCQLQVEKTSLYKKGLLQKMFC